MAVPSFVGVGSGVTITTGTGTVSKTSCTAGNVIFCHMMVDGTATAGLGRSNVVNINRLDGTGPEMDIIQTGMSVGNPQAGKAYAYIGRVIANGTCSMDFTVDSAGNDIFSRMYEFSGVSAGSTVATVIENGASTYTDGAGTSTSLLDIDITTNGPDRLALNAIAINANQALGAFTGMTGGTWAEVTAEYVGTGTVGTLQLQSASMPTSGNINGGAHTITSADWGNVGFALIPAAAAGASAGGSRMLLMGAG